MSQSPLPPASGRGEGLQPPEALNGPSDSMRSSEDVFDFAPENLFDFDPPSRPAPEPPAAASASGVPSPEAGPDGADGHL